MRTRLIASVAAAAACAAGLVAATGTPADAAVRPNGAPSACTASDASIYTQPPATTAGGAGTLIRCEPTTLPEIPGSIPLKAWKVQYVSTDVTYQRVAATGTVIVPTAPWTGAGTRPLVAFVPGTLGLGPQCAFSKQIAGKYQDEYEGDNLAALLEAGYAVATTDGQGYVGADVHPYVAGIAAGHALLDAARTASQVPGAGISASTKVTIWGYSEGGQASLWAAQQAATYAPTLTVVGDASGGVPGDLKPVAAQLNGGAFAGFLADAAVGLATEYPQLPFASLLNATGRQAVAQAESVCLAGTLASFAGDRIESFTTAGYSLDQLYALKGTDGVTWGTRLDQQKLGVGIGTPGSGAKYTLTFPVLQYRGVAEEVISTQAEDATRSAYCRAGITTQWNLYPGDHILTDNEAISDVVAWFGARFSGSPTFGNCRLGG